MSAYNEMFKLIHKDIAFIERAVCQPCKEEI